MYTCQILMELLNISELPIDLKLKFLEYFKLHFRNIYEIDIRVIFFKD